MLANVFDVSINNSYEQKSGEYGMKGIEHLNIHVCFSFLDYIARRKLVANFIFLRIIFQNQVSYG